MTSGVNELGAAWRHCAAQFPSCALRTQNISPSVCSSSPQVRLCSAVGVNERRAPRRRVGQPAPSACSHTTVLLTDIALSGETGYSTTTLLLYQTRPHGIILLNSWGRRAAVSLPSVSSIRPETPVRAQTLAPPTLLRGTVAPTTNKRHKYAMPQGTWRRSAHR